MAQEYKNGAALKAGVHSRLRKYGGDHGANYTRVLSTRFLARLVVLFGERLVLKGGFALELRLENARTTRDIDLSISGSPKQIQSEISEAGNLDLGDFMRFEITPKKEIENVEYQGQTFKVLCFWANKECGTFRIDVNFSQTRGRSDLVLLTNYLEFAAIPSSYIYLYPIETHIAEKLHAYSMPNNKNTRIKDFPDLALLASIRPIRCDITLREYRTHLPYKKYAFSTFHIS